MSNYFNDFITRTLKTNDYEQFSRIPDLLLNDMQLDYITWIDEFYEKNGSLPLPEIVETEKAYHIFINRKLDDRTPTKFLFEQAMLELRTSYLFKIYNDWETEVALGDKTATDRYLDKLEIAYNSANENYTELSKFKNRGLFRKLHGTGIPFGIPFLDETVGGIFPGTYNVLFGPLGSGKTYIMNYIAAYHLLEGRKILYIRGEMQEQEVIARLAGITFGFNATNKIKKANKDIAQADKLDQVIDSYLELIEKRGGSLIFTDKAMPSVRSIKKTYIETQPDLVIVDGIYMLPSAGKENWVKEEKVSRALRDFAKNGIKVNGKLLYPRVIGSTQMNRQGIKDGAPSVEHIAGSIAYAQDADILVAIVQNGFKLNTSLIKSRTSERVRGEVEINWQDMSYNFDSIDVPTSKTTDAISKLCKVVKVDYEKI